MPEFTIHFAHETTAVNVEVVVEQTDFGKFERAIVDAEHPTYPGLRVVDFDRAITKAGDPPQSRRYLLTYQFPLPVSTNS